MTADTKTQRAFYLSGSEAQYLEHIGGGNRSRGLRLAIMAHADKNGNLLSYFRDAAAEYHSQPAGVTAKAFKVILGRHLERAVNAKKLEPDDVLPNDLDIDLVDCLKVEYLDVPKPPKVEAVESEGDLSFLD